MLFFWKPWENARTKVSPAIMKVAVVQVTEHGKSVYATAKDYGIDRKTLGSNIAVIPEQLRTFLQASPRKGRGGQRPLKSRILTSTPLKTALEIEHTLRLEKKRKISTQMKPVTNAKR
ncbi:hypothetical protein PR048_018004, partial [Dryococelus australis]